ncbi:MAG TPA: neutral zinc metallopeptidase [Longimicrobiales bacterium]|nr:neutral zinc metallopeptidase [Longimicrobiales bacterium]
MKLGHQRASQNVEDRRGMGMVGGGLGIGGIVVAVIAYFLGFDPGAAIQVGQQVGGGQQTQQQVQKGAPKDEAGQFVSKVLGSTEDVWGRVFQQSGAQYGAPTLVLFEGQVRSACGVGQAAMGPFYCPGDEKLYIDLSFFRTLHQRLGAPGDFAQAYVIAHEVAHHVQKLSGSFAKLEAARGRGSQAEFNRMSVRMELQADCYAGVWGHHAGALNLLEAGDVEEGLNAAMAIGDDRLQRQAQGRVVPESFTHGTSEQRLRWFKRGLDSGRPQDCDTFSARTL